MKYFEAMGVHKKILYEQAVERTGRQPKDIKCVDVKKDGRRTSQEQAGGQRVQQRNRSSTVRGDASVKSSEAVENEARSTRATTK